jgi:hypothetical protein
VTLPRVSVLLRRPIVSGFIGVVAIVLVSTLAAGLFSSETRVSTAAASPREHHSSAVPKSLLFHPEAHPVPRASVRRPRLVLHRPNHLRTPSLWVALGRSLTPAELRRIGRIPGVGRYTLVDTGVVRIHGARARAIGVAANAFRAWTPKPTARSNAYWRNVALGGLTTSFDLGSNLRLRLGKNAVVTGHRSARLLTDARAESGIPGVDVTVSRAVGARLGLTHDAGLLIETHARHITSVQHRIGRIVGRPHAVQLLQASTAIVDAGEYLTRGQIAAVIKAAKSRVGAPYLWGATGPDRFDCSGLVGFAFHYAGISVPRTAAQLWLSGPHIASADARPGDLLFWSNDPKNPSFIDHVAIYLGSGLMVSAPHTGEFVHVGPLYASNFRGVVRLDPRQAAAVGGPRWPY